MELVPEFAALLQPFARAMTGPTFESLTTLMAGWVLARRRTMTRMILAAGGLADKHYSSYHRVFSAARWSLDQVGLAVFDLIESMDSRGHPVGVGRHPGPQARLKDVRLRHASRSTPFDSQ